MSDTPRTDAAETKHEFAADRWVKSDFARELERELAAAINQRDEARREVCRLDKQLHWEHGNLDPSKFGEEALAAERNWNCFEKEVQP